MYSQTLTLTHYRFLTAIACIARFINAFFLIRLSHAVRVLINTILMLVSFMLLAMSMTQFDRITGFYWCSVACLFHGFSQAFGEATIMGYLKALPSDLVLTFGSGTGLSGFTDVFTVLFLSALGVS
jgi:hypothetical protein